MNPFFRQRVACLSDKLSPLTIKRFSCVMPSSFNRFGELNDSYSHFVCHPFENSLHFFVATVEFECLLKAIVSMFVSIDS